MSHEEKLVSHYQLKTLLRKDGFGAVYLSEDTRDGQECVLRLIELDAPTLARITGRVRARAQRDHPLIEDIRQRIKHIAELKHSHVLPVHEFGEEHIQDNNDIIFYMASPYEKESLLSFWSGHNSNAEMLALEVIGDLIFQAGEALFAVHKRGLVHQYVRLSSFMLRTSSRARKRLHLLLTDFWFADISAAILDEGQIAQSLSVYLAPEQLTGKAIAASDQYALAILAYELLVGYRLSQVDRGLGLYERTVRQRAGEMSELELARARQLDLVLGRALAERPGERFHNIEEFAYAFRSVVRGEAMQPTEEVTSKFPTTSGRNPDEVGTFVAAVEEVMEREVGEEATYTSASSAGTTEMLAAAEIEEGQREHRPVLHKTVLTSEGMEVAANEETLEMASLAVQGNAQSEERARVEEEQTLVLSTNAEERAQYAAAAEDVAFAAGLAAGEMLQREADEAAEQTQLRESNAAAFVAGLGAGEAIEAISLEQEAVSVAEQAGSPGESARAASGLQVGVAIEGEASRAVDVESNETGGEAVESTGVEASEQSGTVLESSSVFGGAILAAEETKSEKTEEVALGAVAGLVGAGVGVLESTPVAGAGLAPGTFAIGSGASVSRWRKRRPLLVALTFALVLVLIGSGILVFASKQGTATVTLTLQSHTIENSYLLTAVTGSITSQEQVQASILTQSVTQSKSAQASGFFQGTHAGGWLTFHNSSTGCGCPVIIPAGTAFTGASGVTVVTDSVASVASLCTVRVPAHAVIFGPGGAIGAGDIHAAFNALISVTNPSAFSGGQPGRSNTLVQQSDITSLATALQSQVLQSARTHLASQVKSNEHLLGTPTCQSQTTSNHAVGDLASSITVTVSTTCRVEVYDYTGALQVVQKEVQAQAATYFSSQFTLLGSLQTTLKSATLIDAQAGTILLAIDATGKWGYQFSKSLEQSLARVIAGKNVSEVRALLASQSGVAAVAIDIAGGERGTLPADDSKITIVLKE